MYCIPHPHAPRLCANPFPSRLGNLLVADELDSNFRSIDTNATPFKKHLAKYPAIISLLKEVGYAPKKEGGTRATIVILAKASV